MSLKFDDVAGLPENHPKYVQFLNELRQLDHAYDELEYNGSSVYSDEDSLDYFNRFIAGDKR